MTPQQFKGLLRNPKPIIGGSLKLVAPTGDYDADKLINVGANRWVMRAEFGMILPLGPVESVGQDMAKVLLGTG